MELTTEQVEYFWSKRSKGPSCWEWLGTINDKGYGVVKFNGKPVRASRLVYFLQHGHWPDGFLCHTCDNPSCINPDHLFLGTQLDNVRDMISKGRQVVLRGDEHKSSKLNESKILEIRKLLLLGLPQSEIASLYGVARTTIEHINIGKTWTHVGRRNYEEKETNH